jgi:CrcB protein
MARVGALLIPLFDRRAHQCALIEGIYFMLSTLVVFVGAGVGGAARHLFNAWVTHLIGTKFPVGILAINVIGSFAMGLVAGWFAFYGEAPQEVRLFLTTGILGGFTTFSAFSLDTALLYERGEPGLAMLYVVLSVALSIGGLFFGLFVTRGA